MKRELTKLSKRIFLLNSEADNMYGVIYCSCISNLVTRMTNRFLKPFINPLLEFGNKIMNRSIKTIQPKTASPHLRTTRFMSFSHGWEIINKNKCNYCSSYWTQDMPSESCAIFMFNSSIGHWEPIAGALTLLSIIKQLQKIYHSNVSMISSLESL